MPPRKSVRVKSAGSSGRTGGAALKKPASKRPATRSSGKSAGAARNVAAGSHGNAAGAAGRSAGAAGRTASSSGRQSGAALKKPASKRTATRSSGKSAGRAGGKTQGAGAKKAAFIRVRQPSTSKGPAAGSSGRSAGTAGRQAGTSGKSSGSSASRGTATPKRISGKRGAPVAPPPKELGSLRDYLKKPLDAAPQRFDYASKVEHFPVALNISLEDCTIAGVIHVLQLAYAELGEKFEYPGDDAVRETYMHLTDGKDVGLDLSTVIKTWATDGLFGHKAVGAPIDFRDHALLAAGGFNFGALYMQVEMPANAERQFEHHEPWDLTPKSGPALDGHCIVGTGVRPTGMDVITWGEQQSLTWSWWRYYGYSAWLIIPDVFEEAGHGAVDTVDVTLLRSDLHTAAAQTRKTGTVAGASRANSGSAIAGGSRADSR